MFPSTPWRTWLHSDRNYSERIPPRKSKWPQSDRNSSKHQPPAKVNDCTPTETIRNANPLAKVIGCSRRRPLAAAAAKRAKGRGQHRCRRCGEPRRSRSTTARGGRMQRRARATNRQPPPPPQARGRCTTGSASMLFGLLDKLTCLLTTPHPPQQGLKICTLKNIPKSILKDFHHDL